MFLSYLIPYQEGTVSQTSRVCCFDLFVLIEMLHSASFFIFLAEKY